MIKSGAVIQNRFGLSTPFESGYNKLARPQNTDTVRPFDPSKAMDTGFPKDVSPYQPRVVEFTEEIPKSVFRPRKYGKRLALKNGAFMGQTALKEIFGGGKGGLVDYMAQRLLGLVEGSANITERFSDNLIPREPPAAFSETTTVADAASPTTANSEPMNQSPTSLADAFNIDLSSTTRPSNPLRIDTSEAGLAPAPPSPAFYTPPTATMAVDQQEQLDDAAAEIDTEPLKAAEGLGLVTQLTDAGTAVIQPRAVRGFGLDDRDEGLSEEQIKTIEARVRRRETGKRREGIKTIRRNDLMDEGDLPAPENELPFHVKRQREAARFDDRPIKARGVLRTEAAVPGQLGPTVKTKGILKRS